MLFHSQIFILGFLPLCLIGFFLAGRLAGRTMALCWLIAASLFFYGWWNPPFTLLLIGSIAGNYGLACLIRRLARASCFIPVDRSIDSSNDGSPNDGRSAATALISCAGTVFGPAAPNPAKPVRRGPHRPHLARICLGGAIAANLGLLAWFKYADFLLAIVAPDNATLSIFLPLAISFFTFQQIIYLTDCLRHPEQNPGFVPYAAFVAFFPHLIAGPLVAPRDIMPQFQAAGLATPDAGNLQAGMTLFLLGLGKKLVLADMFGAFADTGFNAAARGETLTFVEAWFATLAYALQIYFDFSGYSDMAIGLARMLNIRFPLNFDSPYQARDIADFWRRWHITLGLFLRDYVYIPLGGSRHGPTRHLGALAGTMLLGGLWHGAAWQFVLWGGLHGLFLAVHAAYAGPPLPRRLSHGLTLLAVILAWVPFRAADLPTTWSMARGLLGLNGVTLPQMIVAAVPSLGAIADPVPVLLFLGDARTLSFPEVSVCLLLGWIVVLTLPHIHLWHARTRTMGLTAGFALTMQALFFAPHVSPFLYFQF